VCVVEWKNPDWTKRFNMQGTNDASCYVAVGDALDFVEAVGLQKMHTYRRELLEWALAQAQQRWKNTVCVGHTICFASLS
jgi:hypothetical protein